MYKYIECEECTGVMILQKSIFNELMYSCEDCRHYVYLVDDEGNTIIDNN